MQQVGSKYDVAALRDGIAQKQLSISEFASAAGISKFCIYRALSGSLVRTKTLGKISAALGVKPSALIVKEASEIG